MPREHDDAIDVSQYGVLHIGSDTANQDFRITTTSQRICSNKVCEVCGEPLGYSPYHICTRCRIAAQKFRDCLRDEEL